ncbi:hypothetical protein OESDEN_11932 [Oesophagostomum dentatum]|uniref:Uncharacterized protein n=1 Tax=Oesophagostomum dentatum TaxID=61180 RepID=A0A0B1SWJ3_OESDE|nr:hypothetical protein OESDEN_11932 [Oesophagostomum dentatum]
MPEIATVPKTAEEKSWPFGNVRKAEGCFTPLSNKGTPCNISPGRVTPRVTPRVTTLAQRRTPLEPSTRPRTAAPVAANRTPVLRAVRTNVVAQSPAGPVTRARSRELGSRIGSANTVQANAAPRIQRSGTENIENGLRQMRLGGERISRNRAPRTTTSSRSSGLSHLQPVRIQQPRNPDSFLRDEAIPTPYEFRQELLHRNASLGSSERSSSTPKDNVKATANGAGTTSKAPAPSTTRPTTNPSQRPTIRSSSATRPVSAANRPVPRASSVTRIPTSTSASAVRPTARSSSVTRPGVRPPSVTRPYTSSAATRPQGQPAASATRPQLQPTASATERRRPPSVSRPQVRPPSVTRPHIPTTTTKRHDIPRGGALSSSARVPAGRGPVTIQGSARRTNTVRATPTQQRPTEPRSSVIRNPPSNKGPGDGTPVREFRTELRRYPAPTANPITANAPTPTKVLSKQEVTAMINRLSMPRKTTVVATPLKIASEETHGLSCIKTRSRSSSMARRPLSAQDQMRPTTSRALDFAPEDHPRPASADQLEENVTLQEPSNETAP